MAIGLGLGGRGRRVRGAPAHDVSHAGQAGGVLFRRHARAAPRLLGLRAGSGAARSRARRSPARLFVLAALMITGSPPFGMFFSEMTILKAGFLGRAPDGDGGLPGRASSCCSAASPIRSGGSCSDPPRDPTGDVRRRSGSTSGWARRSSRRSWRSSPRSICPVRCWRSIRAATAVVVGGAHDVHDATVAAALGLPDSAVREPRAGELSLAAGRGRAGACRPRCERIWTARLVSLFASDEASRTAASPCTMSSPRRPAGRSCTSSRRVDRAAARVSVDRGEASRRRTGSSGRSWTSSVSSPEGHPNPERVALHDDWPDGAWALRKDFPLDRRCPASPGDFHPFRPVTGEGVFQIPVGPVHAGIIEPGHFRFGVAGEPVLYLQLRLFYVHKGIEKRFERLPWRHGHLPRRIDLRRYRRGSRARVRARHRAARRRRPCRPRARALRVVLLELERMYNHVADIGAHRNRRRVHRARQAARRPCARGWSGCRTRCSARGC